MDGVVLKSQCCGCSALEVCYQRTARQPKQFNPASASGPSSVAQEVIQAKCTGFSFTEMEAKKLQYCLVKQCAQRSFWSKSPSQYTVLSHREPQDAELLLQKPWFALTNVYSGTKSHLVFLMLPFKNTPLSPYREKQNTFF